MAKKKRVVVGSVVKAKDGKGSDYLKIRGDHQLKDGQILQLESQKQQLESLDKAVKEGKLDEEFAEKIRERINKIPTFVRFEVVALVDAE